VTRFSESSATRDPMRVLVVEDEANLACFIARGLARHGMAVDVAGDGELALRKAHARRYDVVILDRKLPAIHGDDVCKSLLRNRPETRVLMLTASGGLDDRVAGLNLGADDYLGKPFAFVELVARVRALGRRSREAAPPVLERDGLRLEPARQEVSRDGRPVLLGRKEFGVLEELMRAGGALVSAEQLLVRVWDENADPFSNVVRVTVMNLRKKLGEPPLVHTVVGAGYRIGGDR
jgi:DNA-binding response OmpR family regulator